MRFASNSNTSGNVIYFPLTGKTLISNQVRLNYDTASDELVLKVKGKNNT